MKRRSFYLAFSDSLPALFGYFPLGLAFGILCIIQTKNFWLGPMMSLFVYAGAAQFLSLGVISAGGSLFEVGLTTFIVNLRHIFYGIPFLNVFKGSILKRTYLIFGITDETYSILTTSPHKNDSSYVFWVTFLTHMYWILGTILGSLVGSNFNFDFSALNFSLIALFVILTIEQAYTIMEFNPFIIGVLSFFLSFLLPKDYFLSVAMALASIFFILEFKFKGIKK